MSGGTFNKTGRTAAGPEKAREERATRARSSATRSSEGGERDGEGPQASARCCRYGCDFLKCKIVLRTFCIAAVYADQSDMVSWQFRAPDGKNKAPQTKEGRTKLETNAIVSTLCGRFFG